jgi:hypothetical protein
MVPKENEMSLASPELEAKGQALLDAAYEYWKQARKEGISGAIIWLDDNDGHTVIFTRGEYRGHLLSNIDHRLGDVRKFTHNMHNAQEVDESQNLTYSSENLTPHSPGHKVPDERPAKRANVHGRPSDAAPEEG